MGGLDPPTQNLACSSQARLEKKLVPHRELLGFGLRQIGDVGLESGKFTISLSESDAVNLERCIYAFVVGDEILRIGSSKGKLGNRLRAWQTDVSNAFNGDFRRTPKGEAEIWRSMLAKHGNGRLYGREGTIAASPIGKFNLYQHEERELIARYRPRCCNDVKLLRNP